MATERTPQPARVPPGLCHLLALAWAAILIPVAVGLLAGPGFGLLAFWVAGAMAWYAAEWVLAPQISAGGSR